MLRCQRLLQDKKKEKKEKGGEAAPAAAAAAPEAGGAAAGKADDVAVDLLDIRCASFVPLSSFFVLFSYAGGVCSPLMALERMLPLRPAPLSSRFVRPSPASPLSK